MAAASTPISEKSSCELDCDSAVGDEALLEGEGEATAHGLRELLEARLGGLLGGVHAGDELGDARLELAHEGDPGGRAEVLGALAAHGLAQVEQGVHVGGLQVVEVGGVARLDQRLGVGGDVVDRVDQVALAGGAVGLRGDHGGLGGGQVVDRGLDDGDLLGTAGSLPRVDEVAGHAQSTEDGGEQQRDRQRQRHLAAQRPACDRDTRAPAGLGCILSHVCLACVSVLDRRNVPRGPEQTQPKESRDIPWRFGRTVGVRV